MKKIINIAERLEVLYAVRVYAPYRRTYLSKINIERLI